MLHIYKASAGSGKTYTLTLEYIKLLLGYRDEQGEYRIYKKSDSSHRRILAVTFTNKATEEMKHRIVAQLDILAHNPEESGYIKSLTTLYRCDVETVRNIAAETLYVLLHDFSYFNISTIDRFFQQVLRNFTREVGLQGSFEVEMDNNFVTASAIDRMYSELSDTGQKDLLNWLVHYAQERIEAGRWWSLGNHAERKDDLRDLAGELNKESYKDYHAEIQEKIKDKTFLDSYLKEMRRIMRDYEAMLKQLGEKAMAIIGQYGLSVADFKGKERGWCSNFSKWAEGSLKPPTATFESMVDNQDGWFNKKDTPSCIQELYADLNPIAQEVMQAFGEPFIEYNTAEQSAKYIYALGILADIGRRIEEYEREHNTLLLSDTAGILNTIIDESDAPFIYEKLGTKVNHFMIDEFQDTSKLQWRNFEPLIRESLSRDLANLIVGDVKQSIYRWRNSDWSLLNERVQQQYSPSQYSELSMDTNYRSCARVVEFNNRVFSDTARVLQEQLTREVNDSALVNRGFDVKIEKAYADIVQKVCDKKTPLLGRVSVSMWYPSKEVGFKAEALNRIPDLLRQLQDRGYKPGDIAFLVRTAKEGVEIVDLLLRLNEENSDPNYCYDVISNESLLIKNSPTINLVIGILRYIQDSTTELNRLVALYEYNRQHRVAEQDSSAFLAYFENRGNIENYFDNDFRSFIEEVRKKPLFEMCECIIARFVNREEATGERVYIQAFQDCVLDYCRSHTVDLGSFLLWWSDNEEKLSVTTPQAQNAMQVMTIHKSKGLEFRAVIIPFCDWGMDHPPFGTNFIWCKPTQAPFNNLPVLPLRYSSKLANTYYAADYFEEKMNAFIDNLNVAYVAFTRAGEELHIMAPRTSNRTDSNRIGTISALLENSLFADDTSGDELLYDTGDDWCAGLMDERNAQLVEKETGDKYVELVNADAYHSIEPGARLRLRLQGKGVFGEGGDRAYGTLMHRILGEITRVEDVKNTVDAFVRAGELSENEADATAQKIYQWLDNETVKPWFAPGIQVWSERAILQPNGTFYRPDRVVELPDEVVVIDYKFGNVERNTYKKQVANYVDLIRAMGYPHVSGFIWYVTLEKITPV